MHVRRPLVFLALACLGEVLIYCSQERRPGDYQVYTYQGGVKHNPDRFSPLPADASFTISIQLEKDIEDGKKVLNMQLLFHNPTMDTLFLVAPGAGTPHYEFVVTKLDYMRVWNRLQTNVLALAAIPLTLPPEETHQFQYQWDYSDYDGNSVVEGKYLVFGGIIGLHKTDGFLGNEIKDFGDVGADPDTLLIN